MRLEFPRCLLSIVDDRDDLDDVLIHPVKHAIALDDQLAYVEVPSLWSLFAQLRMGTKQLHALVDTGDHIFSVNC